MPSYIKQTIAEQVEQVEQAKILCVASIVCAAVSLGCTIISSGVTLYLLFK